MNESNQSNQSNQSYLSLVRLLVLRLRIAVLFNCSVLRLLSGSVRSLVVLLCSRLVFRMSGISALVGIRVLLKLALYVMNDE